MTTGITLQEIKGSDWQRGAPALARREMYLWWGTHRWLVLTVIWTILRSGALAFALYVLPNMASVDGLEISRAETLTTGMQMFSGLGLAGLALGAIVLLQDTIIEEKTSGTAEWVLSKPVSRPAYIVAKLLPNLLGMFVTMLLIPALPGYLLFRSFGAGFSPSQFLVSEGIVALNLLFYVTLTLMLGVLFSSRGPLLAIALGSLLGGSLVPIAAIVQFTPWRFGDLVTLPLMGASLPPIATTMLLSTAAWCALFIGVAIWRFNRQEF